MTNAIEQTRCEMYESFIGVKTYAGCKALVELFEARLEAHLEELRKDRKFCDDVVALSEAKAAKAKEECDTLRNRLQAFEMASQTSAEIIKGLREELKGFKSVSGYMSGTSAQDSKENAASANTDPFAIGFLMVVRAEFDNRIRTTCTACNRTTDEFKKTTAARQQEEGLRSGYRGSNGQAQMRCQHSYHHLHQHCIYCGDRK